MKQVELYARVRYAVQVEGLSERAAARRFGIDPRTVAKMMRFSVPPGYKRTQAPVKPKHRHHRSHPDRGQKSAEEAAAHGQAHFRAVAGRARLGGRHHDREGLCRWLAA